MSGDSGGMDLHVRGGAGGVHANLDAMLVTAGLINHVAADMLDLVASCHEFLVDPDLAASAVLDSAGAARFHAAMLAALDGPDGLTALAGGIGLHAFKLRAQVVAYRTADDLAAALLDVRRLTQGAAVIATLPVLLPTLGVAGAGWLTGETIAGQDPFADLQRLLVDHPGIIDETFGSAPGSISAVFLFALGPVAMSTDCVVRLTPGKTLFPTTIAEGVALLSLLYPDGKAAVKDRGVDRSNRFMIQPPRGFGDLVGGLNHRNRQSPGQIDVRVVERTLLDGSVQRSYIVDIPGTKTWNLPGKDHPQINDLGTNMHALAGDPTAYEQGIAEALRRAGALPHDPVMLIGHSQGGLVAVNAADHFASSGRYRVTHVVTLGSPVAHLRVPRSVRILSVENKHDIFPHLDGRDNPDEPNHTTVTFDEQYGDIGKTMVLSLPTCRQPKNSTALATRRCGISGTAPSRSFMETASPVMSTRSLASIRDMQRREVIIGMNKSGLAFVLVMVVTLSGCSLFGKSERKAVEQARNDAATAAIHDALMQDPHVVEAYVTYINDPTDVGSSGVDLIVREGTDLEQVNDLAVRTVWRSQLDPLVGIAVSVLNEDRTQGISHDYNEFEDWDELEAKYGPRPVPDR